MKKTFASALAGCLLACCGETTTCEGVVAVRLRSHLSGAYRFEGTADGVPFRCGYEVVQYAPEANRVEGASCNTGVVTLSVEPWSDESGAAGDRVRAVFPRAPADVTWTFTDVASAETRSGTLTAEDACDDVAVE